MIGLGNARSALPENGATLRGGKASLVFLTDLGKDLEGLETSWSFPFYFDFIRLLERLGGMLYNRKAKTKEAYYAAIIHFDDQ